MLSKRTLHGGSARLAALIAAAFLSTILATGTASAQTLSLWPGDWLAELTESGTETATAVSFPDHIAPGQIVASFSDRRLYYVYTRGRAVSYPIATPRRQSRWQGVMRISRKKINPSWTPTANMRAENPHLPAYVPGGHPKNPLGKRALYLGSSLYRIHGTGRAVDHRPACFKRLHPNAQPRRCGSLSPRRHRHQGDRDLEELFLILAGRQEIR